MRLISMMQLIKRALTTSKKGGQRVQLKNKTFIPRNFIKLKLKPKSNFKKYVPIKKKALEFLFSPPFFFYYNRMKKTLRALKFERKR